MGAPAIRPFEGLRVIDLSDRLSGAFALGRPREDESPGSGSRKGGLPPRITTRTVALELLHLIEGGDDLLIDLLEKFGMLVRDPANMISSTPESRNSPIR